MRDLLMRKTRRPSHWREQGNRCSISLSPFTPAFTASRVNTLSPQLILIKNFPDDTSASLGGEFMAIVVACFT